MNPTLGQYHPKLKFCVYLTCDFENGLFEHLSCHT